MTSLTDWLRLILRRPRRTPAHRPYSDEVLQDAPLAYWRLGDDHSDSSGNGHHGERVDP